VGKFNFDWLRYGAPALSALLALCTYFLLVIEQRREVPNRPVESLIRIFMVLMVILALSGFGLEQLNRQKVFEPQQAAKAPSKEPDDQIATLTGAETEPADLRGTWKFEHFVRESVDSTGGLANFRYDISGTLRLNQDLTGEIVQTTSQCSQSTLKAIRRGNEITLTTNGTPSKTNPCCADLSYMFTGRILSKNQISWSFTPAKLPKGNCRTGMGTSIWTRETE
jgi:hypothetical protein